jgi:hypothetical protein
MTCISRKCVFKWFDLLECKRLLLDGEDGTSRPKGHIDLLWNGLSYLDVLRLDSSKIKVSREEKT